MKRVIILLVLVMFVLLYISNLTAQKKTIRHVESEWEFVGSTNQHYIYRNIKRTSRTSEGTVLSWEKWIPRKDTSKGREEIERKIKFWTDFVGEEKAKTYSYELVLFEYQCKEGKYHQLDRSGRDIEGNPIRPEIDKLMIMEEWQYAPPESIIAITMEAACRAESESRREGRQKRQRRKKSVSGQIRRT